MSPNNIFLPSFHVWSKGWGIIARPGKVQEIILLDHYYYNITIQQYNALIAQQNW